MEIENKYINLLGCLIYDKRTGEEGMLSSISIQRFIGGYGVYFNAYYNRLNSNRMVFIEDIEKRNIVFLIPFSTNYQKELLGELAQRHKKVIKEFFGDKYREDMIMEIDEEERQKLIRWWENLSLPLENWEHLSDIKKRNDLSH